MLQDNHSRPRLNLVMSAKTKSRLDRLARITEADTSSEVIRNALRLYEAIINHRLNNKELLIRDKSTGETAIYEPFFDVDESSESPKPPHEAEGHKAKPQKMTPQPSLG